jgi:hypothetical protein
MSKFIRPWLHKEGNWYILGKGHCGDDMSPYPHESLIWHQCQVAHGPALSEYTGCWRVRGASLGMPCGVCWEVCPEGLQGLWRLHNWETLDQIHFGKWDGSFYGHIDSDGTYS